MAIKLTPFAKLLVGAIVLVGSGSVLWNLYKNRKPDSADDGAVAAAQTDGGKSAAAFFCRIGMPSSTSRQIFWLNSCQCVMWSGRSAPRDVRRR